MARSTALTSAGEKIGVEIFDYPNENQLNVKHEKYALYGSPILLNKIAQSINAVGDFPSDGTAVAQAGASTTITLAANLPVTGLDIVDLLVVIVGGTGIGQWRKITAFNPGTLVATVPLAWTTIPDNTSQYRLLLDCFTHNELQVAIEYADANATAIIAVSFYDNPVLAVRGPRRFMDSAVTLENLGFQADIKQATFFHGRAYNVGGRGALGAKIRVHGFDVAGTLSLWAGAN